MPEFRTRAKYPVDFVRIQTGQSAPTSLHISWCPVFASEVVYWNSHTPKMRSVQPRSSDQQERDGPQGASVGSRTEDCIRAGHTRKHRGFVLVPLMQIRGGPSEQDLHLRRGLLRRYQWGALIKRRKGRKVVRWPAARARTHLGRGGRARRRV